MNLQGVPLHPGTARGSVLFPSAARQIVSRRESGSLPGKSAIHFIACADEVGRLPFPEGQGIVGWVVARGRQGDTVEETGVPVVGGIEPDVFREGDHLELDGGAGEVILESVEPVHVVTSFLERPDGMILLLRRSEKVGSFQGAWAGVSGFLEDPTPEAQAVREIGEETGVPVEQLSIRARGTPVYARDQDRVFVVHPFRFAVRDPAIRLDWEHVAYEWVTPDELRRRATVPKLDRVWQAVAPSTSPDRSEGKA